MKSIRLSTISLAVAVVVLGGCASIPSGRGSTAQRVCVKTREINSIGALDGSPHAFVTASAKRYYLFGVDKGCIGLRFARGIVIGDRATRVCEDGFSFLSFVHPDMGPTRCRIEEIIPVEDKAAARELIKARASEEEPGTSR